MGLKLDAGGNIVINPLTGLSEQVSGQASLEQDAMSECRCEQGGNFVDATYGRNPLVWKLSQSNTDRVSDIKRIVEKYYMPNLISIKNGIITVQ